MVFFCFVSTMILFQFTWKYFKIEVYLTIYKDLQFIQSISYDDLAQQKKLTALSKSILNSSLINLTLLVLCFSPFIVLYFTYGRNFIYLMMNSISFWLYSLLFSIALFLLIKRNE